MVPENKKWHGLIVFCNECKKSQTAKNHCGHKNRWVYKTDFKFERKRYSKVLKSDNLQDAFSELIGFKDSIKNVKVSPLNLISKDFTILESMEKYFAKVTCQQEFKYNKRKTKDHQNECLRVVNRFGSSLEAAGICLATTPIDNLTVAVLKVFYAYLDENFNIHSDSGIDKHTRILRAFFEFLKKVGMYHGANFFKAIETNSIEGNPVTLTDDEYQKVLEVITPENGVKIHNGVTRNQYSKWLKSAIIIGRHTGLRRDELYNLTWSSIIEHEGGRFFNIIDLKVSQQKGKIYSKVAPITDELYEYLLLIKEDSTGDKIIESGLSKTTFRDNLSRAFTHFYGVAYPNQKVKNFKYLRKTHITELSSILGEEAYQASGHAGSRVLEKHYIDRVAATMMFSKFKNKIAQESKSDFSI